MENQKERVRGSEEDACQSEYFPIVRLFHSQSIFLFDLDSIRLLIGSLFPTLKFPHLLRRNDIFNREKKSRP